MCRAAGLARKATAAATYRPSALRLRWRSAYSPSAGFMSVSVEPGWKIDGDVARAEFKRQPAGKRLQGRLGHEIHRAGSTNDAIRAAGADGNDAAARCKMRDGSLRGEDPRPRRGHPIRVGGYGRGRDVGMGCSHEQSVSFRLPTIALMPYGRNERTAVCGHPIGYKGMIERFVVAG